MYNKNKIEPKLSPSMSLFYCQVDILHVLSHINLTLLLPVTGGQNKNSRKCLISFFFKSPKQTVPCKSTCHTIGFGPQTQELALHHVSP